MNVTNPRHREYIHQDMYWTAPIELSGDAPTPEPDRLWAEPRLVLLYASRERGPERCPVCGQKAGQLLSSPDTPKRFGACIAPPPAELLAGLRAWCRSLGLNEAAAVLRRLARRPYREAPAELAPVVLLEAGKSVEEMGTRPRRSLTDLVAVIRASGPALSKLMTQDEYELFQEQLLDNLWP